MHSAPAYQTASTGAAPVTRWLIAAAALATALTLAQLEGLARRLDLPPMHLEDRP